MKGQVTMYIVVGLLLVLSVGLVVYTTRYAILQPLEREMKEYTITVDSAPLKLYVEKCLRENTLEGLNILSLHGGSLNPTPAILLKGAENEIPVKILCKNEPEQGCVNTYTTLQEIEQELSQYVGQLLDSCLHFEIFERQGFTVTSEKKKVIAKIGQEITAVQLSYPITLNKTQQTFRVEEYTQSIPHPFGKLYTLALHIINHESTEGFFDSVAWMQNHSDIVITKIKDYPNTIYTLTEHQNRKNMTLFNFAIAGEDTVSQLDYVRFGEIKNGHGCCYNSYDTSCYKNTPQEICIAYDGIYEPSTSCTCPEIEIPEKTLCGTLPCKSCKQVNKQHLESWCSYESPTGNGQDLVGSRQYLHFCHNGEEVVEPCRDYREELCTEQPGLKTRAQCRVNRWQDCNRCNTKECCTDGNARDCVWQDFVTEQKCTPRVKPGFKFWGGNGATVCSQATQRKECTGFSCSQEWLDNSAQLCYSYGDCGNYRNVKGALTKQGFFDTDFIKKPSENVFAINNQGTPLRLDPYATTQQSLAQFEQPYLSVVNQHAEMVQAVFSYFDDLTSLSVSEVLNPFEHPPIKVMDIAYCGLWQPPVKGDCGSCGDYLSCSEYKCKSLGRRCIFNNKTCYEPHYNDKQPPLLSVKVNPPYRANATTLTLGKDSDSMAYRGVAITPPLQAYDAFSITIETNEPSQCKLTFTPLTKFNDLPAYYISPEFSTNHTIQLRVPPRVIVPKKMLETLNVSNLNDALAKVQKPLELIRDFKERYKTSLAIAKTFGGGKLIDQLEYYHTQFLELVETISKKIPQYKALMQALTKKFEDGGYYLFVKCSDVHGNENMDNFFVEVNIANATNDTVAPLIVATEPAHGLVATTLLPAEPQSLTVYTNEPAACSYSFKDKPYEEMEYTMECMTNTYAMSSVAGGSYPCKGKIQLDQFEKKIYIRCQDNPKKTWNWPLHIRKILGHPLVENVDHPYINISDNEINARGKLLSKDIVFDMPFNETKLNVYIDEPLICSANTIPLPCTPTTAVDKGLYKCSNKLKLKNPTENLGISISQGTVNLESGTEWKNMILDIYQPLSENYDITLNATNIPVRIHFNEMRNCVLETQTSLQQMPCVQKGSETVCGGTLSHGQWLVRCEKTTPDFGYTITCSQPEPPPQNINNESFVFTLKRSDPLIIEDYEPKAKAGSPFTLSVTLNKETAVCGYYTQDSLTPLAMNKENSMFSAEISDTRSGWLSYSVICKDSYGNKAEKEIKFWKE